MLALIRLTALCCLAVLLVCRLPTCDASDDELQPAKQFRVWATSCSHVPADIRRGRESLANAIRQSEGQVNGAPGFLWDIMIDAGDLSAHQTPPGDNDGRELIRQYRAMKSHRREQVYNVPGNHDAPYFDHTPGSWFRKWGDPLGENTRFSGVDPTRRPFPVEGNWERYRFQAGNILFLMLADRNDAPEPVGRGHSKNRKSGGFPAGAVTRATFNWWKQQVLENQDKIIITMHHHALRDTTIASGKGEGNPRYHGNSGGAEGSSYLYYLIENDDPDNFRFKSDAHVFEDFLHDFQKKYGKGAIDLWVAGHTHVHGPDDNWGGKTITERRWGVHFLQVAALTRHHGGTHPLSRLITFTHGETSASAEVYLHDSSYKNQPIGWYKPAVAKLPLRHPFTAPAAIKRLEPFPEITERHDTPYVPQTKRTGLHPVTNSVAPPDLTATWKETGDGSLQLEKQVLNDTQNLIQQKPAIVRKSPFGGQASLSFSGTNRLRTGNFDMRRWTDITISAWIMTKDKQKTMRIASKDSIGTPGTFMLWREPNGSWAMRAWDNKIGKWQTAAWHTHSVEDGNWHLLTGVVSAQQKKVLFYVDGILRGEAPWTAETLDDTDHCDLVFGADSGQRAFGHTFTGLLHDPRLHKRALTKQQIENHYNSFRQAQ